jgi:hypothetical protein
MHKQSAVAGDLQAFFSERLPGDSSGKSGEKGGEEAGGVPPEEPPM